MIMTCPHCGRTWDNRDGRLGRHRRATYGGGAKIGSNAGFVISAARNHIYGCARATPAERRAVNERDEKRWKRNPPRASIITNNPNHPGLR